MAAGGSTQGNLTVTLTVVSSVGLVVFPNGEKRMIIANAADQADNVSRLQQVKMVQLTPVAAKENPKPTPRKRKH